MAASDDILRRNLSALAVRERDRAERLCLPVRSDHVVADERGAAAIRHGMGLLPLAVTDAWVDEQERAVKPHSEPVLFGLGLGELALRLLKRNDLPNITVYERDPWLIRLFLQKVDCGRSLSSGRLRLRFVSDLIEELPRMAKRQVIPHPMLRDLYAPEWALFESGIGERRALVVTGDLLVNDVIDALRAQGWSVFPWDVAAHAPEELALVVKKVRPSFAISINMVHGLSAACEGFQLPLLIWEIDPRLDALQAVTKAGRTFVFTWRKARVELLRQAGYTNVEYLPLAAPRSRAAAGPATDAERMALDAPLAFVGSSMVDNASRCCKEFLDLYVFWAGGLPDAAREEGALLLDEAMAAQRESLDAYVLPHAIEERFGPFLRAMRARKDVNDPMQLVAEMAAAERRHFLVSNLGQVGISVWGDPGWTSCTEYGARYRGAAGHGAALTDIYRSAGVHVDIGRIYQRDIVTLRVFEALAAGAFLIAEDNESLRELLQPGVHLDAWSTVQELLDKVEYWLAHPDEARRIAAVGQQEVLTHHTVDQRVARMITLAALEH